MKPDAIVVMTEDAVVIAELVSIGLAMYNAMPIAPTDGGRADATRPTAEDRRRVPR